MLENKLSQFKDPSRLTKWTNLSLYCLIVISIISLISSYIEYQLLSDFSRGIYTSQTVAETKAQANDLRQTVIAMIEGLVFLISGILILIWIYRANFNADKLGSFMFFTPRWSIGWYFIPIANLWKPYQAMDEIWQSSINPSNRSTLSNSKILRWWWFLWLAWNFIANISFRLANKAENIDELINANLISQLSNILCVALSFVLIVIIRKVYKMQMSYFKDKTNQQNQT